MDRRLRRRGPLVALVVAGVLAVVGVLLAGPFRVTAPTWVEPTGRAAPATAPPQPVTPGRLGTITTVTYSADRALLIVLGVVVVVILILVIVWLFRRLRQRKVEGEHETTESDASGTETDHSPDAPASAPAMRRGLARALERLDEPGTPSDAVVQAWMGLEETALDAGAPRRPSETPSEYAARVVRRFDADRGAADELRRLYERVRFGGVAADADGVEAARRCLTRLLASWTRDPEAAER